MSKLDIAKMDKSQLMTLLTGASRVAAINQTYYDKYGKLINEFDIEIKDMVFMHRMHALQEKYPEIYEKLKDDSDLKTMTISKNMTNIGSWFHGWRFLVLLVVLFFIFMIFQNFDFAEGIFFFGIFYVGFLIFRRVKFGSSGFRNANAKA